MANINHWEFYQDSSKQWRYKFIAKNNLILFSSEAYHNLSDAEHAVDVLEEAIGQINRMNKQLERHYDRI